MKRPWVASSVWFFGLGIFAATAWAVPSQPSVVTISGRRLIVQKRQPDGTLTVPVPYIIKGVNWNPATQAPKNGPDPTLGGAMVPYGFFFDGPWRPGLQGHDLMNLWLRDQVPQHLADIPLMAQMGINTVRMYSDLGTNPAVYRQVLDTFYNNGIMVVMSVVGSKPDIDSGKHLSVLAMCKNHPAILMWSLGNEWNFNNLYGYANAAAATAGVNAAAAQIKAADSNHPVTSVLGDKFALNPPGPCGADNPGSDVPTIVANAPNVDVWGMNIYRGTSFGSLFNQFMALSGKPFYISEFGTDSFATTQYTKPFNNPAGCKFDARAKVTAGSENQAVQTSFDIGLWNEIAANLAALDTQKCCAGGFVFHFNDALWLVGNFNLNLGDLVNYDGPDGIKGTADDDASYAAYNLDGFEIFGGQPDNVTNEEHFGLVKADRTPKAVYYAFQTALSNLAPLVRLLPMPDLGSLPGVIPLHGQINIHYPYPTTRCVWTFTPQVLIQAGNTTLAAQAQAASFTTASPQLDLSSNLQPGSYLFTFQAYDLNNDPGPSASKSITLAQSNFDAVKIYPNPWRSARGDTQIHFEQLPAGSHIKIFTISGRWVTSFPGSSGTALWNLTNNSGQMVASGVYLYLITDSEGNQLRGKFSIIR